MEVKRVIPVIFLLIGFLGKCESRSEPIPGNTHFDCQETVQPDDIRCFRYYYKYYRTYDGTCNNPVHKEWGAVNTQFGRLTDPMYLDERKVDAPRGFLGSDEKTIPRAHHVSMVLFDVEKINVGNKRSLSTLFMTFGQFLDHDLAESAHGSCSRGCGSWHHPCFPMMFEKNSDSHCTKFSRSKAACQSSTEYTQLKPRQQVNVLTAFIDGSQIYGNSLGTAKSLRNFRRTHKGQLKMTRNGLMPSLGLEACNRPGGCSLSGDVRADENIALHSMHTLWVREHNRIARTLSKIAPSWNGHRVFHETRKIVGAMLQQIVYNEYVPIIARLPKPNKFAHNTNTNPAIFNGFATAAFRYGHSLIPEFFEQLDANYKEKIAPISLRQAFFNTFPIKLFGIEPTMFGLLKGQSNNVDNGFCQSIIRNLFVPLSKKGHNDLPAINIQRGRDHGIPTYGKWREMCGLVPITSWNELIHHMPEEAVVRFSRLYKSPMDIDLYAAGVSEHHVAFLDSRGEGKSLAVGETFECIFKRQFQALRDGDRFFFESDKTLSEAQKREIRKVSLARVLCDNLRGIKTIQPKAFIAQTASNKKVNCRSIKGMNLKVWLRAKGTNNFWKRVPNIHADEEFNDIKDTSDLNFIDDDQSSDEKVKTDDKEIDSILDHLDFSNE